MTYSVILYLDGKSVRASLVSGSPDDWSVRGKSYAVQPEYFGEWAPASNTAGRIVGFKIIPMVDDGYLEEHVLRSDFCRASNVSIDRSEDTYVDIVLFPSEGAVTVGMNRIEAALLRWTQQDIAFRLDGLAERDLASLELIRRQCEWEPNPPSATR